MPKLFVLNSSAGRAYAKVVAAENGRMVFVSPLEPLDPNTSYTLTIDRDRMALTVCTSDVTFKTAQGPDDKHRSPDQPEWVPDGNASAR